MLMLTGSISVRRSPSPRASDCIHNQLRGDSGRQKGRVSTEQVLLGGNALICFLEVDCDGASLH